MKEETGNTGRSYCRGGWKFIFIPFIAAAALLVFGLAVMYLWNAIMPDIFGSLKPITFWQAVGILALAKILFGGFRRGCCGRRWGRRNRGYWGHKYWMDMSEEDKAHLLNWKNLTEEERSKLKEEWKTKYREECMSRWGGKC